MIRKQQDSLVYLQFEQLMEFPHLKHAVFLRHGGFSSQEFDSLNLSLMNGDEPSAVQKNWQTVGEILGVNHLVDAKQCHGTAIESISYGQQGTTSQACDALITNEPETGLMIKHADCQAAIFYDPINHAVANVHCGWRGNVQNIYAKTIEEMHTRYASKPENLLVCISPSLGPMASEFLNYATELPESFLDFQFKPNYFDFWSISRHQLQQSGILTHHIEVAHICTYTCTTDFFSYRRKNVTGRHGTTVALLPK